MRRFSTLGLLTAGALLAAAPRPAAATGAAGGVASRPAVPPTSITGMRIVRGDAGTAVIVATSGAVDVQDFVLTEPNRIVLDFAGATLGTRPPAYDRVVRGGIRNVRIAQHRADVVRIVLELDGPRRYTVTRGEGDIRVDVEGSESFADWSAGDPAKAAPASEPRAESRDLAPAMPEERAAEAAGLPLAALTDGRDSRGARVAQQRSQQPRITVNYYQTDIRDVVAAFATFAGRTIIVGSGVQGQVTAEVKDQPWDVALQAILQAQGLAAAEDAATGIITVDSYANLSARQANEPLVTQMIKLNYASASSLVGTVSSLLSRDCTGQGAATARGEQLGGGQCLARGTVVADSGTNSLLITEVGSRVDNLVGYIRDLDLRTPQVAIKAKIIFVNRSEIEDLGLRYDLGGVGTPGATNESFYNQLAPRRDPNTARPVDVNGDGVNDIVNFTPYAADRVQIGLGGNSVAAIANASARVANPTLSLIFSAALGQFSLTTFLDALQQTQMADVQAEPSTVTLDNRPARIFVGQQIPFRVVDAGTGAAGGATAPRATTQLAEAGIQLLVTPRITNNRQVVLTIAAENSDAQLASSDVGFIINRQQANTQLLVADGETAVIGGLTVTTVNTVRTGIPILVDLPIIGRFFGQVSRQEQKRDLLILVTPHVLDEGERAPVRTPR